MLESIYIINNTFNIVSHYCGIKSDVYPFTYVKCMILILVSCGDNVNLYVHMDYNKKINALHNLFWSRKNLSIYTLIFSVMVLFQSYLEFQMFIILSKLFFIYFCNVLYIWRSQIYNYLMPLYRMPGIYLLLNQVYNF